MPCLRLASKTRLYRSLPCRPGSVSREEARRPLPTEGPACSGLSNIGGESEDFNSVRRRVEAARIKHENMEVQALSTRSPVGLLCSDSGSPACINPAGLHHHALRRLMRRWRQRLRAGGR